MTGEVRRVLLGHIAGAHGIRGAVLIKSYTEQPEDIDAYGPLEDEAGKRYFEIEAESVTPKGVIARIAGVEDRTAAEKLKGIALYVPRDRLPEAEDGEYYHADLVGLAVVDEAGAALGTVVQVLNFGAGDILEVKPPGHAARTELYPMLAGVILSVDLEARQVVVQPPTSVDAGDAPET